MPQAQANSMLGYRKNAVLPTPDAPIMRQCTSSQSTRRIQPFAALHAAENQPLHGRAFLPGTP